MIYNVVRKGANVPHNKYRHQPCKHKHADEDPGAVPHPIKSSQPEKKGLSTKAKDTTYNRYEYAKATV